MGAGEERCSAAAGGHGTHPARSGGERDQEPVQLVHALFQAEDVVGPLEDELRTKTVAASHLHGQPAHVAELDLAPAREEASLPAHTCRAR